MTRPIKFRVYEKRNPKLRFTYVTINDLLDGYPTDFLDNPEEELTFQQFTGLLDINGKEIYEGDIVNAKWNGIYQVFWSKESASFNLAKSNIIDKGAVGGNLNTFDAKTFTIIGNIFENPELIEKK